MICDKCKRETHRLIYDADGYGCQDCKRSVGMKIDAIIGRVRFNKYGVRMTEADAMQIKTNKLRSDGTYKPDPRWR